MRQPPHSFKKDSLFRGPFRFAEVAQPDANQAIALWLPEIDPRSQLERDRGQFLAR